MTEAEWLACQTPQQMLSFRLRTASDRKVRLFACAYARRFWPQLDDERSKQAVEVAEKYADGLATEVDRQKAWNSANEVVVDAVREHDFERAALVVYAQRCLAPCNNEVVRLD